MAREFFCAYHSLLKSVEPLNDAERGRLFTACLCYSMTGAEPELRGNERFVFPMIRGQIDRDNAKYEKTCATNRANGSLGGSARGRWAAAGTRRPPNAPQEEEKDKDNDNDKDDWVPPLPPGGKPRAKRTAEEGQREALSQYTQSPEVGAALWGYLEMRKGKGKPPTQRALTLVLKELDKLSGGEDAKRIAILEQSTRNAWTDVYALKEAADASGRPGKRVPEQQFCQREYRKEDYPDFTPEELEAMSQL